MDRADELSANAPSIELSDSANVAAAVAACGIAFMAKASAPGRAKTRLVSPLTFEEAAALNTAFLQDVAANVMLAARQAARAAKNFAESDRIRDQLAAAGILLEDKAGGATQWRRA